MRIWLAALAFLGTATVVAAHPDVTSVRANAQQLTTWDGVYTTTQADRGEKLYADRCARCHGDALQGVEAAPALAGPSFYGNWDGETLDALFQRMRTSMPQDRPGSLTRAENADVLAYMLRVGKYPAGMEPLDGQGGTLTRIRVLMYRPQP
ncbi:MAG TPA: cytochrome c [Vicinamibacterales bacterium]|nr:cytochrome c [Vicinamibacterales bacterium]